MVILLSESQDIPEPIGRPLVEYKNVLGMIKEEIGNIFLEIFKEEKK